MQAFLVLSLLGLVVALLITERLRPDIVSMLALAGLVALRILPTDQALSGFSNPATVTVACMFVLSAGLQASGLVRLIGDRVLRHGPASETGLLLLLVLTIAPISAFINNTAAVVVFMPIVLRLCHGRGISPSRLLMPMVFLAILGGTCTLIGTSTNILVSSLAAERGLRPFGLFEITPLGLVFLGLGIFYLLLVGRRWLPERVKAEPLAEAHELRGYLSEVQVRNDSPLAGQTLRQARIAERFGLQVIGVVRPGGGLRILADENHRLAAGELLLVKGPAAALVDLGERTGLAVRPGQRPDDAQLDSLESALLEVVVSPGSALEGRTIKEIDFRGRYGATAVALRRHGAELLEKIGRVRLKLGDELLVVAHRDRLDSLRRQGQDFFALQELELPRPRPLQLVLAPLIIAAVVVSAALNVLPIAGSALVGAVLMVLTGCLPPRQVYGSVDWKVIFLLAGVIPLGAARESTGAAGLVVGALLGVAGDFGPRVVLGAIVLLTYLLTGVMSNNATAALMFPLAVGSAEAIGIDSRPLLIGIMFAASAAFYTPFGYQTNLLVYGPGGYRFTDYTRVGGPLNLIYVVASIALIPVLFPF